MTSNPTIEIFGKENCPYCKRAQDECYKYNLSYTYKDVHKDLSDEDFVDLLGRRAPGARTVPIVIVNDEWIGGYTELKKLLFEGFTVNDE